MKILFLLAGYFFVCPLHAQLGITNVANESNIGNETLANPQSPGVSSLLKCSASCTVTQPRIFINDVTVQETAGTALLTISLSSSSSESIIVKYKTNNGTAKHPKDYEKKVDEIVFNPLETSKQISITILSDNESESTENFFVELSKPSNATIADGVGEVTILDGPVSSTRVRTETEPQFLATAIPNPSTNDFLLSILNGNEAVTEITIYDAVGRLIKTFVMKQIDSMRLGKELKTGVYTVMVKQGDKKQILRLMKL